MTYSIVAHDPATGELGVAVASCFFAAGAIVPHLSSVVAIATQAWPNPLYGVEGLGRIAAGEDPAQVLSDMSARDAGRDRRQCHMIDASGRIAAHTGQACSDWAGHAAGPGVSAAGNILAGPDVVDAMVAAYLDSARLPFAERLLAALDAAEAAGGDRRGRQSAGLAVTRGQDWRHLDLRVDDHADPLSELRRLYDVAGEIYLKVADHLPTREAFGRLPPDAVPGPEDPGLSRSRAWARPAG
ncbi:DUF1028 domain-containing protein [Ovoidimarina sediminis]|uniref:DUF1028 domain-containing protein n=1 Tax=Ovoidimarina sediminis TaxID=3079856 RepID=UPI00290959C2|nr:DUF1028 domain-containing protein [Rhodophyticola sp. MJ-SS7]MDU8944410.1 DUF1028 domain-containing protein [Rhodophyticola sp. MJ-SS7]